MKPIVIAGPCIAENYQLLVDVIEPMSVLSQELGFEYVFKASFDKANRSSGGSYRGPIAEECREWFKSLKQKYRFEVLTDVHDTQQVTFWQDACDWMQIPAFLCRQTDLIAATVASGKKINIKKGQFLSPYATSHIVQKALETDRSALQRLALTERGSTFGYADYVVDMRSLAVMSQTKAKIIYDITHSVQKPTGSAQTAGGERKFAPLLARAAAATGYLDGVFLEVHTNPAQAKSDSATQLTVKQATELLRQIVPIMKASADFRLTDLREFKD